MDHEHREANRRNWNERAELHARGRFYDLDGFVAGLTQWLHSSETAELGPVAGKSVVQLQCHLGLDLLSWLRRGATRGVGLDFSENAVAHARRLAQRCGLDARAQFVVADVYDAPAALAAHAPFDVVYVSLGALPWIPVVVRWARVCAALLPPGGLLYLREVHPMLFTLEGGEGDLRVALPYFETREPLREDDATTYGAPDQRMQHTTTFEWNHGVAEIVNAVLGAGFALELLNEHRDVEYQALPSMTRGEDGLYRLPAAQRDLVPLALSLRARKR
jgi:SAM-dependent methyltransferase